MSTTAELNSIGYVCQLVQRTPRAIHAAAEALGIEPTVKINGVPHYDADQLELLNDFFKDQRERSAKR